jgi:dTDP-4-amino-4,6-dideoxygalactose transaminase
VTAKRIPFLSLKPTAEEAVEIREAIDRVVASGWFVLGPECEAFEAEFAAAAKAAHAIGTGNGTDALTLILRALDIGPGDEVITTPLSAVFTSLAILMAGARPVFADIDPRRLTLHPQDVERLVTPRTRAIMPVHLYGQPADMEGLQRVAGRHGLAIVEDCCQAHLATAGGRPVGTLGVAGAFSFYPTKNLGALGDGGAVITNDRALADRVRRLRNGGQATKYHHQEPGINSRLDELQAAVLRARLRHLGAWTARRRELARSYRTHLEGVPSLQLVPQEDAGHVYHLFVLRSSSRDALQASLAAGGVETLIHYPIPIPNQPALAHVDPRACPVADQVCREVLSLPLHIGMTGSDVERVAAVIRDVTAPH